MAKSKLYAVKTDEWTDLLVETVCTHVTVVEDEAGSTTKTKWRSSASDDAVTIDSGMPLDFLSPNNRPYQPGESLGQIQAADANANYAKLEK